MEYRELPSKLSPFNPDLNPPDFSHLSVDKRREAFNKWVQKTYPNDIIIGRKDFISFLLKPFNHNGTYITTIVGRTDPEMYVKHPKTGKPNPYTGVVKKVCRRTVIAGNWSYRNAVQSARERQYVKYGGPIFGTPPMARNGDVKQFEPKHRKWGKRVKGTTFVEHNGNIYVYVRVLSTLRVEYRIDNIKLDFDFIKPYLKDVDSNADWQGVLPENEVHVRTYGFNNVEVATFCGRNLFVLG